MPTVYVSDIQTMLGIWIVTVFCPVKGSQMGPHTKIAKEAFINAIVPLNINFILKIKDVKIYITINFLLLFY